MRVEECMSTPVVITQKDVKINYLKDLFSRKNINAAPVLELDGTITGIVSSSDIAKCHDEGLFVKDIMSPHVHIVLKNNRIQDAASVMIKHHVHHLVVMEEGDVVGMISSMDVMEAFVSKM